MVSVRTRKHRRAKKEAAEAARAQQAADGRVKNPRKNKDNDKKRKRKSRPPQFGTHREEGVRAQHRARAVLEAAEREIKEKGQLNITNTHSFKDPSDGESIAIRQSPTYHKSPLSCQVIHVPARSYLQARETLGCRMKTLNYRLKTPVQPGLD